MNGQMEEVRRAGHELGHRASLPSLEVSPPDSVCSACRSSLNLVLLSLYSRHVA